MKKLINDPRTVVGDSLAGFALAHADLVVLDAAAHIVRRRTSRAGKVAILSGGGSGHEPLHAGFVGHGMLDAAVAGALYTSPSAHAILAGIRSIASDSGVLMVVKNYTGDVLNFETAAELAELEGLRTASVLVSDDVAVADSTFTAGRRGVAGTLVVERLVGAAAERGDGLQALKDLGERVAAETRSMALALRGGILPYSGVPGYELADDEVEFGVGIHGEPGRERRTLEPADILADRMLDAILTDGPTEGPHGSRYSAGDRFVVVVNGLGSTPPAELYILYRRVSERLVAEGMSIERCLVGTFVTSLDTAGASITLTRVDDELLELWDSPVHTASLRWGC